MSTTADTTTKATKTAAKKAEAKKQQPLMYVGPTISGVAIQNRVYTEMPEALEAAKKEVPEFANLCIPVARYAEAEKQIREGKGYICSAFKKALEYKEGGLRNE